MMNKTLRQRAVLEALKHGPIANQEDLQRALRKRGFKVGQATLSRDIHDLNLSKTAARVTPCLRAKALRVWCCLRCIGWFENLSWTCGPRRTFWW